MSNYVKRLFVCLCLLAGVFFASLTTISTTGNHAITIGSKIETESGILAEIIRLIIEKQTDITVHHIANLEGTFVCFNALCSKDIDLYIEYTGTALSAILQSDIHRDDAYIRHAFAERFDMAWLEPLGFENSYALFTKNQRIQNFAALKDQTIRLGVDPEFSARHECEKLISFYAPNIEIMDQDLLFLSNYDVILAAATDARTLKYHRLRDEDELFPIYRPTPLVRNQALKTYPELKEVLLSCKNFITLDEIRKLNIEVDLNHKNPYDVALDYLKSKGFL